MVVDATSSCAGCLLGHFDEEEANHGAVAIEETPGVSTVRDYNRRKAVGDSALAEVGEAAIPYGSVGASHINQVLRNIIFKARSDLVPEALDSEGRLSLDRVALIDPAMAGACNVGSEMGHPVPSHRDRGAHGNRMHRRCFERAGFCPDDDA